MGEKFHIRDVLSILHGRPLGDWRVLRTHDLATFLTGDEDESWKKVQLRCRDHILSRYPNLANAVCPSRQNGPKRDAWIREMAREHGEWLELSPLPTKPQNLNEVQRGLIYFSEWLKRYPIRGNP